MEASGLLEKIVEGTKAERTANGQSSSTNPDYVPSAEDFTSFENTAVFQGDTDDDLDFSKEPIFSEIGGPVLYAIPGFTDLMPDGKPRAFIEVKRSVDYAVSTGRARFAQQRQKFVKDHKGNRTIDDSIVVNYDVAGLFLYKCEHCLAGFRIVDPTSGKTEQYNGRPQHTVAVMRQIKSSKLCQWISDKIDRSLGWDDESESDKSRFPDKAEDSGS